MPSHCPPTPRGRTGASGDPSTPSTRALSAHDGCFFGVLPGVTRGWLDVQEAQLERGCGEDIRPHVDDFSGEVCLLLMHPRAALGVAGDVFRPSGNRASGLPWSSMGFPGVPGAQRAWTELAGPVRDPAAAAESNRLRGAPCCVILVLPSSKTLAWCVRFRPTQRVLLVRGPRCQPVNVVWAGKE